MSWYLYQATCSVAKKVRGSHLFTVFVLVVHFWACHSGQRPPVLRGHEIIGFQTGTNFSCSVINCSNQKLSHVHVHFVAGIDHKASFPLLLHRICEGLQWCIPPENFHVIIHSHQVSSDVIPQSLSLRIQEVKERRGGALSRTTLHPSNSNSASDGGVSVEDDVRPTFESAYTILLGIGIRDVVKWTGLFTSNNKMMQSLKSLKKYDSASDYIYHTDLDEFPDQRMFTKALGELFSGSCDVIRGVWRDRLSISGYPLDVRTDSLLTLQQQFPMRCKLSSQFMPQRTVEKILVYRSDLRVTSGQHAVWCDLSSTHSRSRNNKLPEQESPGDRGKKTTAGNNSTTTRFSSRNSTGLHNNQQQRPQRKRQPQQRKRSLVSSSSSSNDYSTMKDWRDACREHVATRADKSTPAQDILELLPTFSKKGPPKVCQTTVVLDHYKFVSGVERHLFKRALTYHQEGLPWWRQSYNLLEHMREYKGRICVECPEIGCVFSPNSSSKSSSISTTRNKKQE